MLLWRFFFGAGALLGLFLLFLATIVANAEFTMPHPRDPKVKMHLTSRGAVLAPEKRAVGAASEQGPPKIEVVESVYHFGRMDPHTSGKHAFEVRNVGQSPLRLDVAGTSCKCTVGGVSADNVPPGESAFVTLEWNTGYKLQNYSQSAEIRSNDPLRPSFQLQVEGKIRLLFGADQEEVVAPQVLPGKGATVEALLYSQMWEQLEILEIKSTLPGLKHELTSVDAAEAKDLEAKSAKRLKLTIPGDLPEGQFRDVLRIKAASKAQPQETVDFELPLVGKMLRRWTIFGPFTHGDQLDIGQVSQGVSKTLRLTMRLRDEDLSLPLTKIEAQPSFLKVSVQPHREREREIPGLFDLVVEIPEDAPACQYMGNPQGSIRIETGHPRVPEVKLQVLFCVAP